jgi:hypothetical protein
VVKKPVFRLSGFSTPTAHDAPIKSGMKSRASSDQNEKATLP